MADGHYCRQPGFYQWETADLVIKLKKAGVLVGADDIVVSIVQGAARLDLHKDEVSVDEAKDVIGVKFTQEQAGLFEPARATVQVNILSDGERTVSAQGQFSVLANLYREAM